MQPLSAGDPLSTWAPGIFALVIYTFVVLVLIAVLMALSAWLGEQRPSKEKLRPYESGIIPTGEARLRYPVPFFLVAIFFLIFDVEGAFIFAWAIAWRSLGWTGWLQITFFILVLLFGLAYIWARGGLDWRPVSGRK
jgi:NADH-quinone oxidoreductase subunit A